MVGARKAPSLLIMRVGRKHQATTMIFLGIFLDEEAVMYFDVVLVATNSKKQLMLMNWRRSRGVHCTKLVRVHVSAHEGYWFGPCRITYTYNKHI